MSSRSISSASFVSNGSRGGVAGARCHGAESTEPVEDPGDWRGNARCCVVMARRAKKLTTPVVRRRGDDNEEVAVLLG
jgi:hypothetical protein